MPMRQLRPLPKSHDGRLHRYQGQDPTPQQGIFSKPRCHGARNTGSKGGVIPHTHRRDIFDSPKIPIAFARKHWGQSSYAFKAFGKKLVPATQQSRAKNLSAIQFCQGVTGLKGAILFHAGMLPFQEAKKAAYLRIHVPTSSGKIWGCLLGATIRDIAM